MKASIWILPEVFVLIASLQDGGLNVCKNTSTRKNECCAGYEETNGRCTECAVGYTSKQGSLCKPCMNHYYGRRCIQECECHFNMTCHHIRGCIDENAVFPTFSPTTGNPGLVTSQTTNPHHSSSGEDATHVTTLNTSPYQGGFKIELFLYSAPSSGLLVIIVICYVCKKYIKKREARRTHEIAVEGNVRISNSQDVEQMEIREVYHTINDDDVPSLREEDNPYLEVIIGSSSSSTSSTESRQKHYMQMLETSDDLPYEDGDSVNGNIQTKPTKCRNQRRKKHDNDSEANQSIENVEYLNPYNSLAQGIDAGSGYEIPEV